MHTEAAAYHHFFKVLPRAGVMARHVDFGDASGVVRDSSGLCGSGLSSNSEGKISPPSLKP